jgi:hypothetical protein
MCGEGEFRKKKKQTGLHTMAVCAVFPECLPFPEIERHAALGVDYHREKRLIGGGVEKFGSGVARLDL